MLQEPAEMTIHTYAYLSSDTRVRVVKHVEEDVDDIISVRFGDEGLVLEMDEGMVPALVRALERELPSADVDAQPGE
jgi:hypothetical protein